MKKALHRQAIGCSDGLRFKWVLYQVTNFSDPTRFATKYTQTYWQLGQPKFPIKTHWLAQKHKLRVSP